MNKADLCCTVRHCPGTSGPSMSHTTRSLLLNTSRDWQCTARVQAYSPLVPTTPSSSLISMHRPSWWLMYSTRPTCCLLRRQCRSRSRRKGRPPLPTPKWVRSRSVRTSRRATKTQSHRWRGLPGQVLFIPLTRISTGQRARRRAEVVLPMYPPLARGRQGGTRLRCNPAG